MDHAVALLAHHEAGHAAVACSFGFKLKSVRIELATNSGQTDLWGERPPRLLQALILLAGGAAESIIDPAIEMSSASTFSDVIKLDNLLAEHWPRDDDDPKRESKRERIAKLARSRLLVCCRRMAQQSWPSIVRLANALAVRHRIEGEEAEAILAG